jgi:tetratricopeptide (TPR) repeat protein
MNRLYIIFLYVALFQHSMYSISDIQKQAEKAYSEKNYTKAIEFYNSLKNDEGTSYKLHYNLGNSYYKNNQIGLAIYHYELANKLMPNQPDITNNLIIANTKVIDEIQGKDNFFINVIKTGIVHLMQPSQWAIINIISLALTLLSVFIFMFTSQTTIKRICFFATLLFSLTTVLTYIFGQNALKQSAENQFAIILKKETKVFKEPNENSISNFSLHEGTKVKVIESLENYVNIRLDNGNEGWIKEEHLGLF